MKELTLEEKVKIKEKLEKDLKREATPDEEINAESGLRYIVEMLWERIEILEEEIKLKADK